VCAGHGLGLMSIGVTVDKKMTILKHCVQCVCTLRLPAAKQPHPMSVTQIEPHSGETL